MDAHDVSPIVNSAKYDGPECIQPISDDEMPRGSCPCCENVMSDKKPDRILEELHQEIEKLREQGDTTQAPDLVRPIERQIERANERLKKPPKKNWIH
jgi:hypothetical protein